MDVVAGTSNKLSKPAVAVAGRDEATGVASLTKNVDDREASDDAFARAIPDKGETEGRSSPNKVDGAAGASESRSTREDIDADKLFTSEEALSSKKVESAGFAASELVCVNDISEGAIAAAKGPAPPDSIEGADTVSAQ